MRNDEFEPALEAVFGLHARIVGGDSSVADLKTALSHVIDFEHDAVRRHFEAAGSVPFLKPDDPLKRPLFTLTGAADDPLRSGVKRGGYDAAIGARITLKRSIARRLFDVADVGARQAWVKVIDAVVIESMIDWFVEKASHLVDKSFRDDKAPRADHR